MTATASKVQPRVWAGANLPDGWSLTTIGQACELNPAKPRKDALRPDAPVTFVPMPAVDANLGAITTPSVRPFAEVRSGYTAFRDGDVIIAKITPCMENGKAAIVRGMMNGLGFGSTEFHVLRPNGRALAEYLYYYVRQETFRAAAEAEMTGSVGQRRVPAEFLSNAEIPLPPLAEQRRIVEQIEMLWARVNAARQRLSKVPIIMQRFRQSVLAAACSGRLTEDWRRANPSIETAAELVRRIRAERHLRPNRIPALTQHDGWDELPDTWAWVALGELADVGTGATPLRARSDFYAGGTIPWITSSSVNAPLVSSSDEYITDLAIKETNAKVFPEGTLLIAMYGEGRTRGKTAELAFPAATNQALAAIQLTGAAEFCRAYVKLFLQRNYDTIRGLSAGGVQPNLNLGMVRSTPVPIPPLEEQKQIVARVKTLFSLADAIEGRVRAAVLSADRFTQATLAKAFRGELVPTEAELARTERGAFDHLPSEPRRSVAGSVAFR